jgi:hypothetical protein
LCDAQHGNKRDIQQIEPDPFLNTSGGSHAVFAAVTATTLSMMTALGFEHAM